MTEKVPERIWYSPEWNICHRTKQSYHPKADINFGVEYINAESLKELRGVWERYKGRSLATHTEPTRNLWQAIDNLAKKMGWDK